MRLHTAAIDKSRTRRFLDAVNIPLLLWTVALLVYGSIMVTSATSGMTGASALARRHVVGIAVGLVPLGVAWLIDYTKLKHWNGPLMILFALLLVSPRIPGLGDTAKGATSWLQIFGVRLFQPSEPAKLVFIVIMAALISEYEGKIDTPRDAARVLGYLAAAVVLIMLQPDLGTGLVFVGITAAMLLVGGMKGRYFAVLALVAVLGVAGVLGIDSTLDRMAGHDVASRTTRRTGCSCSSGPGA